MVNRLTGLICNFYIDTQSDIKNDLESAIRSGFRKIGEENGVVHEFGNLQKISDAELEGARLFKKRFGKNRNKNEALQLIMNFGLAKDELQAIKVLQYMVDNDIPCRKRYFIQSKNKPLLLSRGRYWFIFLCLPKSGQTMH